MQIIQEFKYINQISSKFTTKIVSNSTHNIAVKYNMSLYRKNPVTTIAQQHSANNKLQ
jgi:hypothetical protein